MCVAPAEHRRVHVCPSQPAGAHLRKHRVKTTAPGPVGMDKDPFHVVEEKGSAHSKSLCDLQSSLSDPDSSADDSRRAKDLAA